MLQGLRSQRLFTFSGRQGLVAGKEGERRRPPSATASAAVDALEDRRLFSGGDASGDVVIDWNEHLLQSLSAQPPRVPLARNMALVHVAIFRRRQRHRPLLRSLLHRRPRLPRRLAGGGRRPGGPRHAGRPVPVPAGGVRRGAGRGPGGHPPGAGPAGRRGRRGVARQILHLRADDGASAVVTYTPPSTDPGQWQPTDVDPVTGKPVPAASAHVPDITPFATVSSSQFPPGPPPALSSPEYAAAFDEAKALGRRTGSARTDDQTLVAGPWRTALGNHQVWNRVAQDVAAAQGTNLADTARLFALMDMSLNDGLATSFGAKFHYGLWRPVTAIRRAGEDGNPATEADPAWAPLHPNTPPYPTYSGNAATIGATCATVLAGVFGGDAVPFQVDWGRYGFPGVTRSYQGFSAAADEQARSRIYGGIHFSFDSAAGRRIGADVAGYVMGHYLRPADAPGKSKAGDAPAAPVNVPPGVFGENRMSDGAGRGEGIVAGVESLGVFDFDNDDAAGPV